MDSKRFTALATTLALAACSDGSSGGAGATPFAPGVHGLGLEVHGWRFDGEWIVALVPERDADRNGDGDFHDLVPSLVRARSGQRKSLPYAVRAFALELEHGFVSFVVPEFAQGGRDLNRDGDALDHVLFVHELRTGATRNLGLAVASVAGRALLAHENTRLAFAVSERDQGETDLDGDGFASDSIVHWLSLPGGRVVSLGLPTRAAPLVAGERVLAGVLERGGDWNEDGDRADQVLHVHDTVLGTTRNLRRAVGGSGVLRAEVDGALLAFLVPESEQGGGDLNGDGNPHGVALEIHDLETGTRFLPALTSAEFQVAGELVRLTALEREPVGFSASDLNGDGDVEDQVTFLYDRLSGTLSDTGLAAPGSTGGHGFAPLPSLDARRAAFLADENAQGELDLNGDGDTVDVVLQLFDGASGRVEGTVHEVGWGFDILALGAEHLVFPKPDELFDQLRKAWVMDVVQGTARPLGYAVVRLGLQEGRVLLWVSEFAQGEDLDGDGQLGSTVLLVHTLASDQTFNTKLAFHASPPWGVAPVLHGDTLVVDVYEPLQGEDLNGDLDLLDTVLVLVRLP